MASHWQEMAALGVSLLAGGYLGWRGVQHALRWGQPRSGTGCGSGCGGCASPGPALIELQGPTSSNELSTETMSSATSPSGTSTS